MTAQKLDGTATAAAIKEELRVRVAALKERGIVPGLGTVLVGDDPGSRWYVNGKHKDCAEVGIESIRVELPEVATQDEIEAEVANIEAQDMLLAYKRQMGLLPEAAPPALGEGAPVVNTEKTLGAADFGPPERGKAHE